MNAVPLSIPVQLEGEIDVYKGCVQPNKKNRRDSWEKTSL